MNNYLDTALVDKAIKFAVDAHADTERRGKGFPYVIHVLEAMEIAATMTSDPEILAAAALHDTVEDTSVTLEQIRREFGGRVADLVDAETDKRNPGPNEKSTWRSRKQEAIDRLAAAPRDAKMVALGDKLSNMRAIARDYKEIGDKLWERFHAPGGRDDHEWHYRNLAISLDDLAGTDAYSEFRKAINEVFGTPKPEPIDLEDYEKSGAGFTAESYFHKGGSRMIKLYADFINPSVPETELKVSWELADMGLNIPKAYRMVTDGKRTGVEFERIRDKVSFAKAIANEPGKLEEYTVGFARMCKRLHSTQCDTRIFRPVSEHFLKTVRDTGFFDDRQKAVMEDFINSIPDATTCIHGDMHIGNAIIANGKNYWIDLSDFSYGNPLFDVGMMYMICAGPYDEGLMQNLYHLSASQLTQVWNVFEREYFGPGADSASIRRMLEPFAALYVLSFSNRDKARDGALEFITEKLINR